MSTHRVEVVRINEIGKHPNADSLGLVLIHGFTCAVRLGDFQVGDLCAYIEPDYVVPSPEEHAAGAQFAFLGAHRRIKAKRLRGTWSQGLLVRAPTGAAEGDDVMEQLGIKRWEPPIEFGADGDAERPCEALAYVPKYDLENWRRYGHLFHDQEIVFVTEKLHGCVPATARITMADGSQRRLAQVEPGDVVMGRDAEGRLVPSRVIRKFNNGKAADGWVRISGPRRNAGRGSAFFALTCTPEHRVWCASRGEYVKASDVVAGDRLLTVRTDADLSPLQHSVLLGKLLGDGYLHDADHTAAVVWSHAEEDAGYVGWTARAIGALAGTEDDGVSGYGTVMVRQRTVGSAFIKHAFAGFYSADGTKRVPEWVADKLDPIAMAFWYMDDGSLAHEPGQQDRALFAVCDFTREDCAVLQRGLRRFGIESVYYTSGPNDSHSRLRLNADDAERFFLLVAPYMPPCMQRKLPERYRGHSGWLPVAGEAYKSMSVDVTVETVETAEVASLRYDLETETHNYFANGILVHNCNARFAFREGRMWAGSRTQWKRPPEDGGSPGDIWWQAIKQNPWIAPWCEAHQDTVLYAEVFGQVQNLRYDTGKGEIRCRAFDILRGNTWMGAEEFWGSVLSDHARVPLLYAGPYSVAKMEELALGDSALAKHLSEGVVITPAEERSDPEIGRVKLKLVSNRYLEKS